MTVTKSSTTSSSLTMQYIQAKGYSNYVNQKDENGTFKNTGETGEEKYKIFDTLYIKSNPES